MDIERLKNNKELEFHDRIWDDADQVMMDYQENPEFCISFWDFYFHQIFDLAEYHGAEWTGFTRDYHACERTLDIGCDVTAISDLDEYLNDLYSYRDKIEQYDDINVRECYNLICDFLAYAKETGMTVMVEEE